MRILGIDPGLADVGFGVLDVEPGHLVLVTYGHIRTQPSRDLFARLAELYADVAEVCRAHRPDVAAMERMIFKGRSSGNETQQARGAIGAALGAADLRVTAFLPHEWKPHLGLAGNEADKDEIAMAVRTVLGLDHLPRPNHAADALGIAYALARVERLGVA